VVLKTSEGLIEALESVLAEKLSGVFDYSEYGGVLLLGVAGLAIVGHGRSSSNAVRNAIAMAYRFATDDVIRRVEQEIAAASVSHH
jgi:glycerol-3-phosphate acyltransferase PlsX